MQKDKIEEMKEKLIDVIIQLFFSLSLDKRTEEPRKGDWCINSERIVASRNKKDCIGILDCYNKETGNYIIKTIDNRNVLWENTEFKKLPVDITGKLLNTRKEDIEIINVEKINSGFNVRFIINGIEQNKIVFTPKLSMTEEEIKDKIIEVLE